MPKIKTLSLAFIAVAVALSGCVMPDQIYQLRKEVSDVQQQVRGIQREQAAANERLTEIQRQLGEEGQTVRRAEFADMQLQVDQTARELAILDERLNDANRRMDNLSQNVQVARELARKRGDTGYRTPSPPVLDPAEGSGAPPADPGATPSAASAMDAVPSPEALYNAAYADFSKGNFSLAVSGFEEYATRFPKSDLADNALYWVGECYFSQGDFARSIASFDRMLSAYPRSDRAAAADLKKGLAYLEQNQVRQAIVQLRYVLDTYPGSDEARIARDKLASLGANVG